MDREEETAMLAQAIEASLRDELEAQSRRLAQQIVEQEQAKCECQAQLEHQKEEERIALQHKRLEEEHDYELQLTQAIEESQQEYAAKQNLSKAMQGTLESSQVFRSLERHEGSWDCQQCTFTNQPYRSHCEQCLAKAPDHVLVFQNIPEMKFGVEIEMFIPQGKSDGFSCDKIANQLTTMGPPSVVYRGYTHETTNYWKIVIDSSLQGNSNRDDVDLCFEVVSPVLQGEEGLLSLRTLMEHVRRLGIGTNRTCSFHVHVDAEPGSILASLTSLQRVAQAFVALENALDLLVSLEWQFNSQQNNNHRRANQNQYCRSNRLAFGEQSNRQRWEDIGGTQSYKQLVRKLNPNYDRYYKLNMTNITKYDRPSTCEFRHHGGVETIQEAEAWVRFLILFCQNAAVHSNLAQVCLLSERSSVKEELSGLFQLVNCAGLEQFFTVERKLFQDQRLQNQWRCVVCHRCFSTSRQLGQHRSALQH